MSSPDGETAGDLSAVYAMAVTIIEERGFAHQYAFKSNGPVDLMRAIGLAERRLGYPASAPDPCHTLADSQGRSCSVLTRELTGEQVVELLRWAATEGLTPKEPSA